MTYLKHIQTLIYDGRRIYNKVGGLRDAANGDEKKFANNLRGLLSQVDNELMKWEDFVISNGRHNMDLGGD